MQMAGAKLRPSAYGPMTSEGFVDRQLGFRSLSRLLPAFDPALSLLGAVPEAIGLIAGFYDVAVMRQPVMGLWEG